MGCVKVQPRRNEGNLHECQAFQVFICQFSPWRDCSPGILGSHRYVIKTAGEVTIRSVTLMAVSSANTPHKGVTGSREPETVPGGPPHGPKGQGLQLIPFCPLLLVGKLQIWCRETWVFSFISASSTLLLHSGHGLSSVRGGRRISAKPGWCQRTSKEASHWAVSPLHLHPPV